MSLPDATLDEARRALEGSPLWDPSGRLEAAGRARLLKQLEPLGARGLEAKIVLLPSDAPITDWRALWQELGLDADADLLLLDAGGRWEARGWGQPAGRISTLLDAAEPARDRDLGLGLQAAISGLSGGAVASADGAPAAEGEAEGETSGGIGLMGGLLGAMGLAGSLTIGGLGFVLWRRRQAARATGDAVEAARSEAESTIAAITMRAEALDTADARAIQERAASLTSRLSAAARAEGDATVRVGRLRQIEAEAAALHASTLQSATLQKRGR
jgi:hypothetical protein